MSGSANSTKGEGKEFTDYRKGEAFRGEFHFGWNDWGKPPGNEQKKVRLKGGTDS